MGDRGNVYVTNSATEGFQADEFLGGKRGIYVYSHWAGSDLPEMVRSALAVGRGRWDDDAYLTRILIDQICKDGRDQETGYGVSLKLTDNEHSITVVDLGRRQVAWAREGEERDPSRWQDRISFADFVQLEEVGFPVSVGSYG